MKYIVSGPNKLGRIGHQFSNWSAGLGLSKICNAQFIHTPFAGKAVKWENVLKFHRAFGDIADAEYDNIINLPPLSLGHDPSILPAEKAQKNLEEWCRIIGCAPDHTLFMIPYDSFAGVLNKEIASFRGELQACYWADNSKYDFSLGDNTQEDVINIGIHIRRGDISPEQCGARWLDISYYKKILGALRHCGAWNSPVRFYIFSEKAYLNPLVGGNPLARPNEFDKLLADDVELVLDGSDIEAFRMMCSVDVLVTGLSTFSILAAYLRKLPVIYHKLLSYTPWESLSGFTDVDEFLKPIKA